MNLVIAPSALPTPLPDALQPDGPSAWSRDGAPVGTVTFHAAEGKPFVLANGSDRTKKVTTATATSDVYAAATESAYDAVPGGSFDDAVAQAAKLAQVGNAAYGIMQARSGALFVTKLWASAFKETPLDFEFPKGFTIDRGLSSDVARVDAQSSSPALQAIVGALSIIDLRSGAANTVAR